MADRDVRGGLGHNGGPTLERGASWRRHCWSAARRHLLPTLPLEVIRTRVARAKALGLDYPTYATIRATGGGDIVAFLFSSNALRLLRERDELPKMHTARLSAIERAGRIALACPPLDAARLEERLRESGAPLDAARPAPGFPAGWGHQRKALLAALAPERFSPGRVVLVGDTGLEREWCAAGMLAGYVPADTYFS